MGVKRDPQEIAPARLFDPSNLDSLKVLGETHSHEISSVIAPSRLFKGLVLDSHNILPKIFPENIKSVQIIEGNGGVGSIKIINFSEGSPIKCMKLEIGALDASNFYCKHSVMEIDPPFDKIRCIDNEVKLTEAENGCVCKITTKFRVKEGEELGLDDLKEGINILLGLFQAVELYIKKHPDLSA